MQDNQQQDDDDDGVSSGIKLKGTLPELFVEHSKDPTTGMYFESFNPCQHLSVRNTILAKWWFIYVLFFYLIS